MQMNQNSSDEELKELSQKGDQALQMLKELALKTDSKELNDKIKQSLVHIYPALDGSNKDSFKDFEKESGMNQTTKKLPFDSFTEGPTEPSMYTMKMAKLNTFKKGDNFARFCERFCECIALTKVEDENLYLYFLQHVDDTSYSLLRPVELTRNQKRDCQQFCTIYKDVIYGEESMPLKNELRNLQQEVDEDIIEYSSRLREKGSIAFEDRQEDTMELECLLAFMNGLQSKYIKRKLGEHNVSEFNEAVKLAMRFEKIEKITNPPAVHSIMKQKSNVSFEPKVEEHPASSTDDTQQEAVALRQTPYRSRPRERASTDNRGASRDSYNRSWSKDRNRSWSRDSNQRSLSRTSDDRSSTRSNSRDSRGWNERSPSRDNSQSRDQDRWRERSPPYNRNHGSGGPNQPRYPIRRNQSNKDKVCWGCGKTGHIRRFCFNRGYQPRSRNFQDHNRTWSNSSQRQFNSPSRNGQSPNWPRENYRSPHLN